MEAGNTRRESVTRGRLHKCLQETDCNRHQIVLNGYIEIDDDIK